MWAPPSRTNQQCPGYVVYHRRTTKSVGGGSKYLANACTMAPSWSPHRVGSRPCVWQDNHPTASDRNSEQVGIHVRSMDHHLRYDGSHQFASSMGPHGGKARTAHLASMPHRHPPVSVTKAPHVLPAQCCTHKQSRRLQRQGLGMAASMLA